MLNYLRRLLPFLARWENSSSTYATANNWSEGRTKQTNPYPINTKPLSRHYRDIVESDIRSHLLHRISKTKDIIPFGRIFAARSINERNHNYETNFNHDSHYDQYGAGEL